MTDPKLTPEEELARLAKCIRLGDDPLAILRIAVADAHARGFAEGVEAALAEVPVEYPNTRKRVRALTPGPAASAAKDGKP